MFQISPNIIFSKRDRKMASTLAMKTRKASPGDGQFYEGLEPQSAQALVSSLSNVSIVTNSSSSDRLEFQGGRSTYYNRGFEVDHDPAGVPRAFIVAHGAHSEHDEGYKPVEVLSVKKRSTDA